MLHILIVGGTGFIGSYLAKGLCDRALVSVMGRGDHFQDFEIPDVIINLAGEPLGKRRWNEKVKKQIYDSRIQTTAKINAYIQTLFKKPKLFLSGSAIGIYGNSLDLVFTEDTPISPKDFSKWDFSQKLVHDWEEEAIKASQFGVRVCLLRTGIVLGKNGGALQQMLPPFRLGLGAVLGTGEQWMSWVHMEDILGAIGFLIDHEIEGPVNLTAPTPVRNQEFSKQIASTLNRPLFFKLPQFLVRSLFGEMADSLLLKGQNVVPHKLKELGYHFKFDTLKSALDDLLIK